MTCPLNHAVADPQSVFDRADILSLVGVAVSSLFIVVVLVTAVLVTVALVARNRERRKPAHSAEEFSPAQVSEYILFQWHDFKKLCNDYN